MMFFKIYVMFCLITFLVVEIGIYEVQQQVKRKYADKINIIEDKVKKSFLEKICTHIKMFIICFVPIINIGMFWLVLFNGVKLEEETLSKIEETINRSEF